MVALKTHKRLSSAIPSFKTSIAGTALSFCASTVLHMSVIGGIVALSSYIHDAGGGAGKMEYAPIFVTLVQEPSPLPQTPEKIESPALQNDRRDDVQKALDLTLADPVPAPTEKNEKRGKAPRLPGQQLKHLQCADKTARMQVVEETQKFAIKIWCVRQ